LSETHEFTLRPATLGDRDDLRALIAQSALQLSRGYYEQEQIEAALKGAFGVDTSLIEDGTYFVAQTRAMLIGCGGWSRRKTMFGGDQFSARNAALLDPKTDAARIRAFFVHPEWARKGVGRAILDRCESEAARAGFRSFELMATLPGVPFYRAAGYEGNEPARYELAPGVEIEFLPMAKPLPSRD
jgi:GNAT superfamily N-acetyltransferase